MSHPGRSTPAIYAELTVAAAATQPLVQPGNPETYCYGRYCPGVELPVGYTLQGWMDGEPFVGTSLRVFRMVRNGIRRSGEFGSAIITSVADGAFTTANATFHWKINEEVIWPTVGEIPIHQRRQFQAWLLGNQPLSTYGTKEGSEFSIFPQDYWNWCDGKTASHKTQKMDYLTRKSVAKQYGLVGAWTYRSRSCKYPRLSAIGVCHPDDNREIKEVLDDLALDLEIGTNSVRWRPEEIEAALAAVGTPKELHQKAREALVRIAATSKFKQPERPSSNSPDKSSHG